MKLSSRVKNISASLTLAITAKAKKLKKEGIDIIGFASGEPDFDTPQDIKNAAIEAIQSGFTKYTPASGMEELKEEVARKLERENSLFYKPSQIVINCGAKHSIYNIIQALCDAGDEVLIPSPYWLSYPEMVSLAGAKSVFIKTGEEGNFKIDRTSLGKHITKKTKVLILNSPSNPSGCVYTERELTDLVDILIERNIIVISDEIYERIIFDGLRHTSIASLDEEIFKRCVVVNGVSKSYAMTGWRIGYLASADEELVDAIKKIQSHSTSNPTSISQKAALSALQGRSDNLVKEMVREFEKRRNYIVERINKIKGLSSIKPQGAFYVFCRFDRRGLGSLDLTNALLDEARVAVVPGVVFGSDKHIRLSFATSMDNIQEGMDRLQAWFEK